MSTSSEDSQRKKPSENQKKIISGGQTMALLHSVSSSSSYFLDLNDFVVHVIANVSFDSNSRHTFLTNSMSFVICSETHTTRRPVWMQSKKGSFSSSIKSSNGMVRRRKLSMADWKTYKPVPNWLHLMFYVLNINFKFSTSIIEMRTVVIK